MIAIVVVVVATVCVFCFVDDDDDDDIFSDTNSLINAMINTLLVYPYTRFKFKFKAIQIR